MRWIARPGTLGPMVQVRAITLVSPARIAMRLKFDSESDPIQSPQLMALWNAEIPLPDNRSQPVALDLQPGWDLQQLVINDSDRVIDWTTMDRPSGARNSGRATRIVLWPEPEDAPEKVLKLTARGRRTWPRNTFGIRPERSVTRTAKNGGGDAPFVSIPPTSFLRVVDVPADSVVAIVPPSGFYFFASAATLPGSLSSDSLPISTRTMLGLVSRDALVLRAATGETPSVQLRRPPPTLNGEIEMWIRAAAPAGSRLIDGDRTNAKSMTAIDPQDVSRVPIQQSLRIQCSTAGAPLETLRLAGIDLPDESFGEASDARWEWTLQHSALPRPLALSPSILPASTEPSRSGVQASQAGTGSTLSFRLPKDLPREFVVIGQRQYLRRGGETHQEPLPSLPDAQRCSVYATIASPLRVVGTRGPVQRVPITDTKSKGQSRVRYDASEPAELLFSAPTSPAGERIGAVDPEAIYLEQKTNILASAGGAAEIVLQLRPAARQAIVLNHEQNLRLIDARVQATSIGNSGSDSNASSRPALTKNAASSNGGISATGDSSSMETDAAARRAGDPTRRRSSNRSINLESTRIIQSPGTIRIPAELVSPGDWITLRLLRPSEGRQSVIQRWRPPRINVEGVTLKHGRRFSLSDGSIRVLGRFSDGRLWLAERQMLLPLAIVWGLCFAGTVLIVSVTPSRGTQVVRLFVQSMLVALFLIVFWNHADQLAIESISQWNIAGWMIAAIAVPTISAVLLCQSLFRNPHGGSRNGDQQDSSNEFSSGDFSVDTGNLNQLSSIRSVGSIARPGDASRGGSLFFHAPTNPHWQGSRPAFAKIVIWVRRWFLPFLVVATWVSATATRTDAQPPILAGESPVTATGRKTPFGDANSAVSRQRPSTSGVYPILVPENEDHSVAGEIVYIPDSLYWILQEGRNSLGAPGGVFDSQNGNQNRFNLSALFRWSVCNVTLPSMPDAMEDSDPNELEPSAGGENNTNAPGRNPAALTADVSLRFGLAGKLKSSEDSPNPSLLTPREILLPIDASEIKEASWIIAESVRPIKWSPLTQRAGTEQNDTSLFFIPSGQTGVLRIELSVPVQRQEDRFLLPMRVTPIVDSELSVQSQDVVQSLTVDGVRGLIDFRQPDDQGNSRGFDAEMGATPRFTLSWKRSGRRINDSDKRVSQRRYYVSTSDTQATIECEVTPGRDAVNEGETVEVLVRFPIAPILSGNDWRMVRQQESAGLQQLTLAASRNEPGAVRLLWQMPITPTSSVIGSGDLQDTNLHSTPEVSAKISLPDVTIANALTSDDVLLGLFASNQSTLLPDGLVVRPVRFPSTRTPDEPDDGNSSSDVEEEAPLPFGISSLERAGENDEVQAMSVDTFYAAWQGYRGNLDGVYQTIGLPTLRWTQQSARPWQATQETHVHLAADGQQYVAVSGTISSGDGPSPSIRMPIDPSFEVLSAQLSDAGGVRSISTSHGGLPDATNAGTRMNGRQPDKTSLRSVLLLPVMEAQQETRFQILLRSIPSMRPPMAPAALRCQIDGVGLTRRRFLVSHDQDVRLDIRNRDWFEQHDWQPDPVGDAYPPAFSDSMGQMVDASRSLIAVSVQQTGDISNISSGEIPVRLQARRERTRVKMRGVVSLLWNNGRWSMQTDLFCRDDGQRRGPFLFDLELPSMYARDITCDNPDVNWLRVSSTRSDRQLIRIQLPAADADASGGGGRWRRITFFSRGGAESDGRVAVPQIRIVSNRVDAEWMFSVPTRLTTQSVKWSFRGAVPMQPNAACEWIPGDITKRSTDGVENANPLISDPVRQWFRVNAPQWNCQLRSAGADESTPRCTLASHRLLLGQTTSGPLLLSRFDLQPASLTDVRLIVPPNIQPLACWVAGARTPMDPEPMESDAGKSPDTAFRIPLRYSQLAQPIAVLFKYRVPNSEDAEGADFAVGESSENHSVMRLPLLSVPSQATWFDLSSDQPTEGKVIAVQGSDAVAGQRSADQENWVRRNLDDYEIASRGSILQMCQSSIDALAERPVDEVAVWLAMWANRFQTTDDNPSNEEEWSAQSRTFSEFQIGTIGDQASLPRFDDQTPIVPDFFARRLFLADGAVGTIPVWHSELQRFAQKEQEKIAGRIQAAEIRPIGSGATAASLPGISWIRGQPLAIQILVAAALSIAAWLFTMVITRVIVRRFPRSWLISPMV
ncbi:MAG: hypothetical protein AAFP90_02615, partial [Planctomycetota bacterium]